MIVSGFLIVVGVVGSLFFPGASFLIFTLAGLLVIYYTPPRVTDRGDIDK